MIVRLSSLAARFYVKDGWSTEILNNYLVEGKFVENKLFEETYYILSVGSKYDVKKLLADFPYLEIRCLYGDVDVSDREKLLKSRNWGEVVNGAFFNGDSVVDNDLETILPITIKSFLYLLIIEPVLKRIKSYLNY